MIEPLRMSFDVSCDQHHAFAVWTERASAWWPTDHTVSREPGLQIVFEPRVGGRIFERSQNGREHEWGEVTVWDPPRRLAYLWYVATERANATDVEIRFRRLGADATRIEIEHAGWERLGPQMGRPWRDTNQGGWDATLPVYIAACARVFMNDIGKGVTSTMVTVSGDGTTAHPWELKTPPGTANYQMWRDEAADPPAIVCQVGGTQLRYYLRAIEDLHAMLKQHGDWMPLGGADEQKPAADGSVEAWARSADNPVGGWYGLKKGLRGRFGVYMPPLMEALGLAEVEHNARNNRMRAQ